MNSKTKTSQSEKDSQNAENISLQTDILQDIHQEIKKLNQGISQLQEEIQEMQSAQKWSNIWLFLIALPIILGGIFLFSLYGTITYYVSRFF